MSSQDVRSRVEKFARIADAAYYNQNRGGLRRVLEGDAQTRGFRVDELLTSDESLVLYNPQTREVVISFRGTVPSAKDLATDLTIGLGVHARTQRYRQSVTLTRVVQQKYGAMGYNPVEVAGHSLGGGIAAYVANLDGTLTAHVYNAAISAHELFDDQWDNDDTAGVIYSNSTRSDPVSGLQGNFLTHASSVTNYRIRHVWLPVSNNRGVTGAHTIRGNFYNTSSTASVVKKSVSDPQKRKRIKEEAQRGKDIVDILLEASDESLPDAAADVNRMAAALKVAQGIPTVVKSAVQSNKDGTTKPFDDAVKDVVIASATAAQGISVIPIGKLLDTEGGRAIDWSQRGYYNMHIDQRDPGIKYVQVSGQGFVDTVQRTKIEPAPVVELQAPSEPYRGY